MPFPLNSSVSCAEEERLHPREEFAARQAKEAREKALKEEREAAQREKEEAEQAERAAKQRREAAAVQAAQQQKEKAAKKKKAAAEKADDDWLTAFAAENQAKIKAMKHNPGNQGKKKKKKKQEAKGGGSRRLLQLDGAESGEEVLVNSVEMLDYWLDRAFFTKSVDVTQPTVTDLTSDIALGQQSISCATTGVCDSIGAQPGACSESTPGQPQCTCKAGFTGDLCNVRRRCEEVNPCQNGAVCENSAGDDTEGFVCLCADSGYSQPYCELDNEISVMEYGAFDLLRQLIMPERTDLLEAESQV